MKKIHSSVLLAAFCIALLFPQTKTDGLFSAAAKNDKKHENHVPGELLVKFKNSVEFSNLNSIHSETNASVVENFPDLGWQLLRLPDGVSTEQGLAKYSNFAEIESVQPNYVYSVAATPNDGGFSHLYGMQKISAPQAWDATTGNQNVIVAVIDTGVRRTHEDLAANIWQNPGEIAGNGVDEDANGYVDDANGFDFINNDGDPSDDFNHGTHVAGTIGAAGNNGKGVVGVNWNVKIMALKIHNARGFSTSADIIEAFNYVRMMKTRGVNVRVTNNSYGGCSEACGYDQATKDAIDAAGRADVLNVFAAGNNSRNIEADQFYPAGFDSPSILSVASSDQNDNRSVFSNYGTTSVDLAAPGSGILSAANGGDDAYLFFNGTSMAAPHAAGAAALLLAANPNLSAASVKATLMNTVDAFQHWKNSVKTGGRINVARAIDEQTVCTFASPTAQDLNFTSAGGTGGIFVTAPQHCGYTGFSDASWIRATPIEGSGQMFFNVERNLTGIPRTANLEVGGRIFHVNQSAVLPTAARSEISGRVVNERGRGIANISLELTGSNLSEPKYARTNSLGYYRFSEIEVGQTYFVSARGKRFSFAPAIQTVNMTGAVQELNFTAQ